MVKEYEHKIISGLWQLQQSGAFCDTAVITEGNVELQAHAVVLAAASCQLSSLLQHNSADRQDTCRYRLYINCNVTIARALLQFIYTGEQTALKCADRVDLVDCCSQLGIDVASANVDSTANVAQYFLADPLQSGNCNRIFDSMNYSHDCRQQMVPNSQHCINTTVGIQAHYYNSRESAFKIQGNVDSATVNRSKASTKHRKVNSARQRQIGAVAQLSSKGQATFSRNDAHSPSSSVTEMEKMDISCCHSYCKQLDSVADSVTCTSDVQLEDGRADMNCSTVDAGVLKQSDNNLSFGAEKWQTRNRRKYAFVETNSASGRSAMRFRSHLCGTCSHRCTTAAALKRHQLTHADNGVKYASAVCRTCGKKFSQSSYLRYHEMLHSNSVRPYICDTCGKGFVCKSVLTAHRRSHTGERPYACSVCQKRFFQLSNVREHEKIHTGVKLFICDVCGKQFLTCAQLVNHSRTHSGVKSFQCVQCKKCFYTNGDLVKHARIHNDKKPFVCDVCGKGFKYSSNLHGHSRIHTESRPYECQTCGKAFKCRSHLKRHAKLHSRKNTAVGDADIRTEKQHDIPPPPAETVGKSTDSVVVTPATAQAPPAVILVQSEVLLGAPQVPATLVRGFSNQFFCCSLPN